MTRAATIAIVLASIASPAAAHGLDEYVQALRVGVARDRVTLDLGLTPGVAVAAKVIARLDVDADGTISPFEAERYGHMVIDDLAVTLDGTPLALRLAHIDVPPPGEMRDGLGTIRITAVGPASLPTGRHAIIVRNIHRLEPRSYLANALLPEEDAIRVVRQERDATQQTFTLNVEIAGDRTTALGWTLAGAALLLLHAGWRTARARLGILKA
jgi:nickel/cobalt transporter (NicO) family protein